LPVVETVLGPVTAHELGEVDAHEHVFLRTPVNPGDEFLDADKAAAELQRVAASGIRTVVDLTPVGLGRHPGQLAELSRTSGIHIVAATGFHRSAHYPAAHWARHAEPPRTPPWTFWTSTACRPGGFCSPTPTATPIRNSTST
jgi:predicted metal-dependent phosphotriesterase family hydrolase